MATYRSDELGIWPVIVPIATAGATAYSSWQKRKAASELATAQEKARAAAREREERKRRERQQTQRNLLIGSAVAGAGILGVLALT